MVIVSSKTPNPSPEISTKMTTLDDNGRQYFKHFKRFMTIMTIMTIMTFNAFKPFKPSNDSIAYLNPLNHLNECVFWPFSNEKKTWNKADTNAIYSIYYWNLADLGLFTLLFTIMDLKKKRVLCYTFVYKQSGNGW